MTHGALFNGIGGFQLAASWCGWDNVFSVEIDKWCNKVTAQHFPECIQYEDIYNFDGKRYAGSIDVISGGFPCQPFSVAGKRKGKDDDRHLWPEMLRVIEEIRPTWVVGENVAGIVNMVLDEVLSDLENIGYESQALIIPACATNAPHRRDRVWIIAHSDSIGTRTGRTASDATRNHDFGNIGSQNTRQIPQFGNRTQQSNDSYADDIGLRRDKQRQGQEQSARGGWDTDWYEVATSLCRVDDGVPAVVDRAKRLKALGNAIVPQVAYEIFAAIMKI